MVSILDQRGEMPDGHSRGGAYEVTVVGNRKGDAVTATPAVVEPSGGSSKRPVLR